MTSLLQTNWDAFMHQFGETLIGLIVALVCGGAVGLERESSHRPAGLRTHALVCVGSALVMKVSLHMWALTQFGLQGNGDPGRIAAQVVSGIGFLGAGTIMREGANIRGLTTAASLWVVSAIGLAVGAQMYAISIAAVLMVVLTLKTLSEVERRYFFKSANHTLILNVSDTPGRLGDLATVCGRWGANIRGVNIRGGHAPGTVEVSFNVKMTGRNPDTVGLVGDLMATEGVISVTEEE